MIDVKLTLLAARSSFGPRTGGSSLYKTRKAMWPYPDDILNDIRTFLSIIIIRLSTSRDGHIAH